ncbi:MAG: VOC family protein [Acidimicrobiales bacterium]
MADLAIVIDCAEPEGLASFWTAALGYRRRGAVGQYIALAPERGQSGPGLILQQVPEAKAVKNRVHLDIDLSADEDLDAAVTWLEQLGATRLADGEVHEHGMHWVRLADPEGNELCVCHEHPS